MAKKNNKTIIVIIITIAIIIAVPAVVYGYNSYNYNKYYNLALQNLEEDKYEEAITEFNKALEFKSDKNDEINTQVNLIEKLKQSKADYEKGDALFNERKYIEAIASFEKVIKEDEKRYNTAQEKISESRNLFISENISKAKEQADNKNYEEAIKFLDTVINFDASNNEAIELKNQYTAEIEREKVELAKKEAEEKAKQQVAQNSPKQSNPSSVGDGSGASYTFHDGWFSTKEGSLDGQFGVRNIYFDTQPEMLKFEVMAFGKELDYEITFYFQEKAFTYRGKTSNTRKAVSASDVGDPISQSVKITISITYQGRQYTETFYRYLKRN